MGWLGRACHRRRSTTAWRPSSLEQFGGGGVGLGDGADLQDAGGDMGQDGEGAGFDLGSQAIGLAQEDGGIGLAVFTYGEDFGYKDDYQYSDVFPVVKRYN